MCFYGDFRYFEKVAELMKDLSVEDLISLILNKESKPRKVALGAVMHKVSNIIFAVLRDFKLHEIVNVLLLTQL